MSDLSPAGVLGSHKLRQLREAGYEPVDRERLERAVLLGLSLAEARREHEREYEPRFDGSAWPATRERVEFFRELADDLDLEVNQ